MRLRELPRMMNEFPLSTIAFGVAFALGGCDSSASSGGGNAPSSLVGKTMQINKWLASVTFSTASEARLDFATCIGTCTESGTSTYSYSPTGPGSPRFKLSYSYTEKSAIPKQNSKTTGDFDLTLDFSGPNYGTADGSQSYTFVNYVSGKTSKTNNVFSDAPFTLIGS